MCYKVGLDLHDIVALELFGMKFDHCFDKEEVVQEVERRLQTLKN
jgi:hypothetical protein